MGSKTNKKWEKRAIEVLIPHIKSFVDKSLQKGMILNMEIGSNYLSPFMTSYHPTNYIHIDSKKPSMWVDSLSHVDVFDTILCSDFSLETDPFSRCSANISLENGKKLLLEIEKKFKDLSTIKYSDHDLDVFCKNMSVNQQEDLLHFLNQLFEKGQISENQKSGMTKKYNLQSTKKKPSPPLPVNQNPDLLLPVIEECLSHHMHKGSRFIGLCGDVKSKFESTRFFEKIITNPHYGYQEKLISVEDITILGFVVEKLGN